MLSRKTLLSESRKGLIKPLMSLPEPLPRLRAGRLRILMIEDNPGDAVLLRKALQKAFGTSFVEIFHYSNLREALLFLENEVVDLVTVDLHLPDSLELDSVKATKAVVPYIPIIVVTGWADREAARAALRLGAQDYIIKGRLNPDSLRWNIESAIERQNTVNQTEEQRRSEIRKNQSKDELLSMTAHDLRSPLIGVIGFLHSIVRGDVLDKLSPEQKSIFELMLANCEHVLSLSDEIVMAHKKTADLFKLNPQFTLLEPYLNNILKDTLPLASIKNIKLQLDRRNAPKAFNFDPHLIRRALDNLIHNAISYSPESSCVCIRASRTQKGLRISVKDSGPGIEPSQLEEIFTDRRTFHRSEEESQIKPKGLGLMIAKKIVESHGGTISAKSILGKGSTFKIELPVSFPNLQNSL